MINFCNTFLKIKNFKLLGSFLMENCCTWVWEFLSKLWLSKTDGAWCRKRTVSLKCRNSNFFPSWRRNPLMVQVPIIAASRSHSDKPKSVAVLLTRDRPDAETSTRQYTTLTKDRNPCSRWRDWNTQSQQASGPQTQALDRAAPGIGQEDRYLDGYPSTWNVQRPNDHRSCFVTDLPAHGCQHCWKEGIELCVVLCVASISAVTYTISQIANPVFQWPNRTRINSTTN
jgi:hypothetical protein